jgi:hypothetical protein
LQQKGRPEAAISVLVPLSGLRRAIVLHQESLHSLGLVRQHRGYRECREGSPGSDAGSCPRRAPPDGYASVDRHRYTARSSISTWTHSTRRSSIILAGCYRWYRFAQPDPRTGNMTHRLTLVPAIGRKAQELPLHRIDLGEIGGDEVIAAPLAGHHLKITACECSGGTGAAEMDEGSEILFLLWVPSLPVRGREPPRHCGPDTRTSARWHGWGSCGYRGW